MFKNNKKDTNLEEKKKHKALKISLCAFLSLIIIALASFIVLKILITDKERSTYKDAGLTNQEIINKEYVNALSTMDDSFNFKLSSSDINVLLDNSLKVEEVSKYVNDAYYDYDEENNNHMWCFDLDIPLFDTRLIINTHISSLEDNTYAFLIDSMKMGKVNVYSLLKNKELINDSLFNTLFSNASLPLTCSLDKGVFIYEPLKFINDFNLKELTFELFENVKSKDNLSVKNSEFGFSLDLTKIKVNSLNDSTSSYDLISKVSDATKIEKYQSLNSGEQSVLEVSEEDFSLWIKDFFTKDLIIEEIESNLVNTKIKGMIKSVEASFLNNNLTLMWTLSLNDFCFKVSETLGEGLQGDALSFLLSFDRLTNECPLQVILMDDFLSNATSTGVINYYSSSDTIELNFTDCIDNLTIRVATFKRLQIVNNKLTFFLTK